MAEEKSLVIKIIPQVDQAAAAQVDKEKEKWAKPVNTPVGAGGAGGGAGGAGGGAGGGMTSARVRAGGPASGIVPQTPAAGMLTPVFGPRVDQAIADQVWANTGSVIPGDKRVASAINSYNLRQQARADARAAAEQRAIYNREIAPYLSASAYTPPKSTPRAYRDPSRVRAEQTRVAAVEKYFEGMLARQEQADLVGMVSGAAGPRDPDEYLSSARAKASYFRSRYRQFAANEARFNRSRDAALFAEFLQQERAEARRGVAADLGLDPAGDDIAGIQAEADAAYQKRLDRRAKSQAGGGGGPGGGRGGGRGGRPGAAGNVPWYQWGGVGGGTIFGMESHFTAIAAGYFAYRATATAAQAVNDLYRSSMMIGMGNSRGALEAEYQNALRVNESYLSRTWENLKNYNPLTMAYNAISGNGVDLRWGQSERYLANAGEQVRSQQSSMGLRTGRAENRGIRREAEIAANAAVAQLIMDPIDRARYQQREQANAARTRIQSEIDVIDARIQNAQNLGAAGMKELGDLQAQRKVLEERQKAAWNLAWQQGQAGVNAARLRHQVAGTVAGFGGDALRATIRGDSLAALDARLTEKYTPLWLAASGSDPASRALHARYTENYRAERQLGQREINTQQIASRAAVWGAMAAAQGDFTMQRAAIWADFSAATQGMTRGSAEWNIQYNQRMAQDVKLSAQERQSWAYANASRAVATAQAQGRSWTQAHMSAYQQFATATANLAPWTPGYIAASYEFYGQTEALKRQQWISNERIKANTAQAELQAQFKPVTGAFLNTYNEGALSAMENPEQDELIRKNTRARLKAGWAQYLSSTRMGSGSEGFSWQVGTSGEETGYEGFKDLGHFLTKLNSRIDEAFSPLSDIYNQ